METAKGITTINSSSVAGLNVLTARGQASDRPRPPLLFVHGAWHGAWCWQENFLPYFADRGYDAHALDLRGHGKSPATKQMRWNRIRDYVDDVMAVCKTLKQPPVVIGHSMGGLVCQHLMHRTDQLAGIGLLATVPSYGVWRATANIALRRPLDFAKVNLMLSLWPLVSDPQKAKHMFLDIDADNAETLAFAAKLTDEAWLGFLDMLVFDLPRRSTVKIPIIIVGGQNDTLFAPTSQHHTARFYSCDCKIVADAPHDLMLSKHWQLAAGHLLAWLESI